MWMIRRQRDDLTYGYTKVPIVGKFMSERRDLLRYISRLEASRFSLTMPHSVRQLRAPLKDFGPY